MNVKLASFPLSCFFGLALFAETVQGPVELRRWSPAPGKVAVAFASPKGEKLWGLGQFQDGALEIRNLPRRLLQQNSQASVPLLMSSEGWAVLINHSSQIDFNPCENEIKLVEKTDEKRELAKTTDMNGLGGRREEWPLDGSFEVSTAGDYAFMLDQRVGFTSMVNRHVVEIDDKTVIEERNLQTIPSRGFRLHLSAGRHNVRVWRGDGERPALFFRPFRDETVFVVDAVDSPTNLSYTVFKEGSVAENLAAYRKTTGGTGGLPEYAFGYWHCRERFHSQKELLETLHEFKRREIPLDVIVQDWQWWKDGTWNSLEWDPKRYPDPKGMVDEVHAQGVKLLLSVWHNTQKCTFAEEMAKIGGFVGGSDRWVDVTNPEAVDLYYRWFDKNVLSTGVDGLWFDAVEPENDGLKHKSLKAGSGAELRNAYPYLANAAAHDHITKVRPEVPYLALTRCYHTGQNKIPCVLWSGDVGSGWEDLRKQVVAGLGTAFSGIPWWTSDAGGFFRPSDQYTNAAYHKRMIRWFEFATFCPIQRLHGYVSKTEPWHYPPEIAAKMVDLINLRYRLKPYIVEEAKRAAETNGQLMRPLAFDFADDPTAVDQDLEYMFGSRYLVAPITTADDTRAVYLPKGANWKDFWSDKVYEGGTAITVTLPLGKIPVFEKVSSTKVWNRNWEFRRGDEASYQPCHLPHSFSAPYFLGTDFYTGDGFYRKTLTAAETDAEHVFLDFEAAFQVAEVAVDGKTVATHASGYTGFRADLTPALTRGKPAVVTVRVNNEWNKVIAPRGGEHAFSGGIYRSVRLVREGATWIDRNGLKVTTPVADPVRSTVAARVKVCGKGSTQVVLAFNGEKVVKEVTAPCEVSHVFTVENAKLWTPETPNLYPLTARVGASEQKANVGIRSIRFDKDEGFFLNGEHYFLLGANVHQDHAGWGDGITDASAERDVRLMKEAGFNFIRGSHYPHSKAFRDACDKIGLFFWSEGGVWGTGGCKPGNRWWNASCVPEDDADVPAFQASAETLVREMIDESYNHPSIIVWSVSNEPFFVAPYDRSRASREVVRHLLGVVKSLDPTRPAAIGGAQRPGKGDGFAGLGEDLLGYNGDGARMFKHPAVANLVSEYGSPINTRPGRAGFSWGDFKNERPAWRSGAAIWCGFDHGSIWPDGSRMGLVDYFRLPKANYYTYVEYLTGRKGPAPAVKGVATRLALEAEKTELAACDGTDDTQLVVKLLDDEGRIVDDKREVTLTVMKGPGEFPTGRSITFTYREPRDRSPAIDLRDGLAAIALRANFAGTTVVRATCEGLASTEVTIISRRGACTDADVDWVEGVSKRTPDRPWTGPYSRAQAAAEKGTANLALNRPCRASSNETAAMLAADGDPKSAWTPAADDRAPWLIQDLEFGFPVKRIETAGDKVLRVEVSFDGETFVLQGQLEKVRYVRVVLAAGGSLRELRIY